MLVVSCSHGKHVGHSIAKKLNKRHSYLITDKFPDGELYMRFKPVIKNRHIVLVQSFYKDISDCIIEAVLPQGQRMN